MDFDVWSELSKIYPGRLRMVMSGDAHICLRLQKGDDALPFIHKMFEKYMEIRHQTV
jgi:hypothetical protein